eukprot:14479795-Ditylum_brightwellii.AAC.1
MEPGSRNDLGQKGRSECNNFRRPVIQQKRFKGKTLNLKGHIFDTDYALQADLLSICPTYLPQQTVQAYVEST